MSIVTRACNRLQRVNFYGSQFVNKGNCSLFGRCFPRGKSWSLEAKALSQMRFSKTSAKKIPSETKSQAFKNYALGCGSLLTALASFVAAYGGYRAYENSNKKEKQLNNEIEDNRDFFEAAKKIGLVNAQEYATINSSALSEYYKEAKLELYIIGVTGDRIFDGKKGTHNPIPSTIKSLVDKGVKVKLMVYDPDNTELHKDRVNPSIRIEKIKRSILKGKELQKQTSGCFEIRLLQTVPPFHGDIIDGARADVTPIRRTGLGFTKNAFTETYIDSGTKITDIKSDFETTWKNSKKLY